MKIIMLSNMYPSKKDGLFGVFVKNFKKKLEAEGAVFKKSVVIKGKTSNPLIKLLKYVLYYFRALWNGVFFKSDFIYVHFLSHNSPLIIILGKLFNKSIVVNIHGSDIMKFHDKPILKKLNTTAITNCERIVVPSAYFSEIILKTFPKTDSQNILIYPSGGINKEVFKGDKEKPAEKDNTLRLGMTSRMDKDKGWDVFLKAIATLCEEGYAITGTIIGQGNMETQMLRLRDTLNLTEQVEFLGLLAQQKIAEEYKKMDLFIFPTKLNESLGLVGIEAMACGLPVIASDIGAPSQYIKNNTNGFLFETDNTDDLVLKIKSYIKLSDVEKSKLVKEALKTSSGYDSDIVASKLYNELKQLC